MSKVAEELRSWSDAIQLQDIEDNIDDADEQSLINHQDKDGKNLGVVIQEMPERYDVYQGDREGADQYLRSIPVPDNMIEVRDHKTYKVLKNAKGSTYIAVGNDGKQLGIVNGVPGKQNILKIDSSTAHSDSKGVMYQIFMDILGDGQRILSDTLHSPGAEKFWSRLISDPKHFVYVVFDKKPQMRATPDKLHKYWGEEGSVSAGIQFLLMK